MTPSLEVLPTFSGFDGGQIEVEYIEGGGFRREGLGVGLAMSNSGGGSESKNVQDNAAGVVSWWSLPEYSAINIDGPPHNPSFKATV
ncbi:hypothetical protein TSUD_381660 [Trifolium subterraneum]|uniref:Uncharacterized protein n=1 Tax=Trifolium subterraneum TaxID=3900 RepID=A0A2Z6LQ11_TRISU|nr:hypothetical protein TSUD_381660 [Trifolium subterraneum]